MAAMAVVGRERRQEMNAYRTKIHRIRIEVDEQ